MALIFGRREVPKLFTFDLEGTIVDLELLHFLAFERALFDLSLILSVDQIASIEGAIGGGDPFIAEAIAKRFENDANEILLKKNSHFALLLKEHHMSPRDGFVDVAKNLKDRGFPIFLGSLTPRARGELILKKSGIDQYFDQVFFKEDVSRVKPSPDIYLKTAFVGGVISAHQMVFEDSPVGLKAAHDAGSRVVAVPPPLFQREDYMKRVLPEAGAEKVFGGWFEVLESLDELFR